LHLPDLSSLILITVNHQKAPLDALRRLEDAVEDAYRELYSYTDEMIVLATCNRFEIYAYIPSMNESEFLVRVFKFISRKIGDDATKYTVVKRGLSVARHLFRVAAGLESMILGENEILGQVRRAYRYACDNSYAAKYLSLLFTSAIKAGKRVRSETRISAGSVGFPGAAIKLAERIVGGLDGRKVLVIGAGEAGTIIAENIRKKYPRAEIHIANRTYSKAVRLAEAVNGVPHGLDELPCILQGVDVAFIAVSAPEPLIRSWMVGEKAPIVIDISLNPMVDEEARKRLKYYGFQDVRSVVEELIEARRSEVPKAERIIEEELEKFKKVWNRKAADEAIAELMRYTEAVIREEVEELASRLRGIGVDGAATDLTRAFAYSLAKKLLRPLILYMHEAARNHNYTVLEEITSRYRRELLSKYAGRRRP